MRADFPSRPGRRRAVPLMTIVALASLAGCKTEQSSDDPKVIGVPPPTAYLGVEYAYNFGADGGDRILDYSLSNAPTWLGLEDTSNKARQGIIMRGVPGITGGERGPEDLGKTENITLLTTDGDRVGLQPFSIEVRENEITMAAASVVEGTADDSDLGDPDADSDDDADSSDDDTPSTYCEPPVMASGRHTYTRNLYGEDGSLAGSEERTEVTEPLAVKVTLEQPSVIPVTIAFELDSGFQPERCDNGVSAPHQQCEYGQDNRNQAIIGRDVVLWGSNSAEDLPVPEYLQYLPDDDGHYTQGLITLAPGITECYIRLEVINDTVAEQNETFRVSMTEVREGLASFGNDTDLDLGLSIEDDEPRAILETLQGNSRDVINAGGGAEFVSPEYRVTLDGKRDTTFSVQLNGGEASTALIENDYRIQVRDGNGQWQNSRRLDFPAGELERRFRLVVPANYSNLLANDKFANLVIDQVYQAGRENFAGAVPDTALRVSLNELTGLAPVAEESDFVASDLLVAHDGRSFVAGYRRSDGAPMVRIFDRLGQPSLGETVFPNVAVAAEALPLLSFQEERVGEDTLRSLLVTWGTRDALAGQTNAGGIDLVTVLFRFDTAAQPPAYVETWRIQSGSGGDDIPRWVGLTEENTVMITGETTGAWPEQSAAGGVDSFAQRIDSNLEGDTLVPEVAWTEQGGSGLDDRVVGGSLFQNGVLLAGSSAGAVAGEPQLGGQDLYFYDVLDASQPLDVNQVGTEADDNGSAMVLDDSLLWLLGNSRGLYAAEEAGDDDGGNGGGELTLVRTATNSQAGFLLRYSPSGLLNGAIALNDANDVATEAFRVAALLDGDVIVAGSSDGVFAEDASNPQGQPQPVLARITLSRTQDDDDDSGDGDDGDDGDDGNGDDDGGQNEEIGEVVWRSQAAIDNATVVRLGEYRNEEITALVESGNPGNRRWHLVLFSGDGRQLNAGP